MFWLLFQIPFAILLGLIGVAVFFGLPYAAMECDVSFKERCLGALVGMSIGAAIGALSGLWIIHIFRSLF